MHRRWIALITLSLAACGMLSACKESSPKHNDSRTHSQESDHAHEHVSEDHDHSGGSGHDDEHGDSHDESGHAHGSHFHLAPKMVVLGRRFSAIWFAGINKNHGMLHYQIHEIEELLAEVKRANPTENGINVADRLKSDVVSRLHGLEKEAKNDEKAFRASYKKIVQNCSTCHADTGHDYLDVTLPTRNPYSNLDLSGSTHESTDTSSE